MPNCVPNKYLKELVDYDETILRDIAKDLLQARKQCARLKEKIINLEKLQNKS